MHFKCFVILLSSVIGLISLTNAQKCRKVSAVTNVDINYLTSVDPWYQIYTTDAEHHCATFNFSQSPRRPDCLIMSFLTVISSSGDLDKKSQFLEIIAPGHYRVWNTSDPYFDPINPGDVEPFGYIIFLYFRHNVIALAHCLSIEKPGFVHRSGPALYHVAVPYLKYNYGIVVEAVVSYVKLQGAVTGVLREPTKNCTYAPSAAFTSDSLVRDILSILQNPLEFII